MFKMLGLFEVSGLRKWCGLWNTRSRHHQRSTIGLDHPPPPTTTSAKIALALLRRNCQPTKVTTGDAPYVSAKTFEELNLSPELD